ncbi:ABC transporter permease [Pseudoluteimonas lycopersici]|uniref:ABC transporter permease n=1 Tax=Pseudoluteimonas lycopersici TaxID=1324796 RepID=UPI00163D5708|nr:ABC transporter permease [Lysobacter lycopersici]
MNPPLRGKTPSSPQATLRDWSQALRSPALWMNLALEDLRDRYRRTVLGVAWIAISFALFVGVKVLVFGQMSAASTREFAIFVTIGFGAWSFISSMVTDACGAYLHSRAWILGTAVPYPVYLLQATLRNWMVFALVMLVMAIALLWKPTPWTPTALFALPALLAYFVTSVWLSALLAPLCVRYHDLLHAVQTSMRLMFFITPILWMPGTNGMLAELARINPMTHYLAILRDPLLYNTVSFASWEVVLAINAAGLLFGSLVYASTRQKVAFWI